MTAKRESLEFDTLSIEAMNTNFYLAVSGCEQENWKEVMVKWVRFVEKEWSRFRENNELRLVNSLKVGESITISPPLLDVLIRAEAYRRKTSGYFSPYLLEQMKFHGYNQSFPIHKSKSLVIPMMPVYQKETSPFLFNHRATKITRIAEGQIDLGGIGKGYTVQAASQWLKNIGNASAGIVDGGGDITLWSDGSKEWTIGVAHPTNEHKEIAQFRLKNASIATSNIIYRSWFQENIKKHHILNGKTGLPADNRFIQATIISENLLDAEVGAKVCLMVEESTIEMELSKFMTNFIYLLVDNQGKVVAGMEE